jgi:hypothetical protein
MHNNQIEKRVGGGQHDEREGVDDARQGGKGLPMARQSGGRQHNKRRGAEDTTQSNWVADGKMRRGEADNAHALVVDSFSGGGGRGCTQDILETVPQKRTSNHAKPPSENLIFQGGFCTI